MSFMDKGIAAMNVAFWSDLSSGLRPLHVQMVEDGVDSDTSATQTRWLGDEASIDDPMLTRLLTYWRHARFGAQMPSPLAIDPFALRFALGHLVVLEPTRDNVDFKVRLYGSQLAVRVGYDLTGKTLSAVTDPEVRRSTEQSCARVLFAGRPLLMQRRRRLEDRSVGYTCLFLPFGSDTPNRIVIGIRYDD